VGPAWLGQVGAPGPRGAGPHLATVCSSPGSRRTWVRGAPLRWAVPFPWLSPDRPSGAVCPSRRGVSERADGRPAPGGTAGGRLSSPAGGRRLFAISIFVLLL